MTTPIERLGNPPVRHLSQARLKELIRTRIEGTKLFSLYGLTGTNVAYMTSEECLSFLLTGDTSFRDRLIALETKGDKQPSDSDEFESISPDSPEEKKSAGREKETAGELLTKALEMLNPGSAELEKKLTHYIDHKLSTLVEKLPTRKIEVTSNGATRPVSGATHERFELVLKTIAAGIPCALVGPAGSGKTTVCDQIGEALGLDVRPMSFNPLSSKSDILGFRDANGNYHATLFRTCFESGGIFVADEFDAANPGVATILNAAIANRKCSFADNVTVTADARFGAAVLMNTYGTGATSEYVGRNRLDAATLDRFAFIDFGYDNHLEHELIGASDTRKRTIPDYSENPVRDADHWLLVVRNYRAAAHKLGLRHIISPRASIMGMKLAAQGIGVRWLVPMLLTKGLQGEDLANLEREALRQ